MHIYIFIYTYRVHIYIYTYIHKHVYACVCICTYVRIDSVIHILNIDRFIDGWIATAGATAWALEVKLLESDPELAHIFEDLMRPVMDLGLLPII